MSTPTTSRETACPVCGDAVLAQTGRGQPRRYCSSRCKSRAARTRHVERVESQSERATENSPAGETAGLLASSSRLTREAAVELVSRDPTALNAALQAARPMLISPVHRTSGWREVAVTVKGLAAAIPDDID